MSSFRKIIVRCEVDVDEIISPFKTLRGGSTPHIWAGVGVEFQFLFRRNGEILDVSNFVSITLTILSALRTGLPFMTGTIALAALDQTVTEETWADGSKQHASMSFLGSETGMTGSVDGTEYFLILSGFTTDAAIDPDDLGWTRLHVHSDGIPADVGPIQAGNLIPGGAAYDGSGHYVLAVTINTYYKWTDGGANDTSVTNGAQTVNTSDANFITQGTSITLNGTAGQPVTAVIRKSPFITADEVAALIASKIGAVIGVLSGSQAVGNGVENVTVDISAFALVATPTRIIPHIAKPANGANIFCCLRDGSATSTQFMVDLSAQTENANYKISYLLIQ